MAIPSGIAAQLGIVDEVTYGTGVTVTRFHEIENESIKLDVQHIESKALRSGQRVLRSDRQAINRKGAAGSVEMPWQSNGMGLLQKHMTGVAALTTPSGGTLSRKIRSVPTDPTGLFFTAQVGRPDVAGTVQPFTYLGCKIPSWELSCDVDGALMVKFDVDAKDETTGTALASASYAATSELLYFTGGQVSLGGTYSFPASVDTVTSGVAVDAKKFSLKCDNKLATDRAFLRSSSLKKEPLPNDFQEIEGSIDVEFSTLTDYARYTSGTPFVLRAVFVGSLIEGAIFRQVEIILPCVRCDGETPNVGGPDILEHTLSFKVLQDAANPTFPPYIINCLTTDTTV